MDLADRIANVWIFTCRPDGIDNHGLRPLVWILCRPDGIDNHGFGLWSGSLTVQMVVANFRGLVAIAAILKGEHSVVWIFTVQWSARCLDLYCPDSTVSRSYLLILPLWCGAGLSASVPKTPQLLLQFSNASLGGSKLGLQLLVLGQQ